MRGIPAPFHLLLVRGHGGGGGSTEPPFSVPNASQTGHLSPALVTNRISAYGIEGGGVGGWEGGRGVHSPFFENMLPRHPLGDL